MLIRRSGVLIRRSGVLIRWSGVLIRWSGLIVVNLAAVTFFLLSYSRHGVSFGPYRIDLDVYRIGSRVWLRGGNLYGTLPLTSSGARLPFSYPPLAAVLLAPLSLIPMTAATTVLTLASIGLTALVLRVFLGSGSGSGSWSGSWRMVAWLLPGALFLEPVRNTLNYGQVNAVLMALVTADCLTARPRWPRGALVGLAAAVKLTPAAFVLFFLLRRDYRAAGTACASFAVATSAGFLFAGHDSVVYWTSVVFQSGRPGNPDYAANQSITGVLARAGADPHSVAGMAAWLALSVVVVVLACRGMRHTFDLSADGWAPPAGAWAPPAGAWALSLNAFAALLISPISWSHHWVWGVPAMLALALRGYRRGRRGGLALALALAGLVVFAAAPQWWFPSGGNRELHWAWWQQLLGSSYVILALVVLALSASRGLARQFADGGEGRGGQRDAVGPLDRAPVRQGDHAGVEQLRAVEEGGDLVPRARREVDAGGRVGGPGRLDHAVRHAVARGGGDDQEAAGSEAGADRRDDRGRVVLVADEVEH
jgi:alpha-1,2-mannosyltransferase